MRARLVWSRRQRLGAVVALAVLCFSGAGHAQQTPTFRAGVDVIRVDVSVLDKDRHPVHGLTAADFTILEDGKPQRIIGFSAVNVASTPAAPTPWMHDIAPDVQNNDLTDSRLFVLVMDDALLPRDQRILDNEKTVAQKAIDHLGPNDLMAMVFTADNRNTQDFTRDHSKLKAAVDKVQGGFATYKLGYDTGTPPSSGGGGGKGAATVSTGDDRIDTDAQFRQYTLDAMQDVTDYLIAAPDRRKALIYVGVGVPIDYTAESAPSALGTGSGLADREAALRLVQQLPDMFRQMQRANVNVYSVDPSGTAGIEAFVAAQLRAVPLQEPTPTNLAHDMATRDVDFLNATAANTGGRAIINTDNFDAGIDGIFEENSSYYLLGYQPADGSANGALHRLDIKVNRPDLEVHSRHGYYAPDADKAKAVSTASPLTKAIAGMLPDPDLPMQVALAPIGMSVPGQATVAIMLGLGQPAPPSPVEDQVDLLTTAFTPEGTTKGSQQQTAKVELLSGGTDDIAHYEALSHIDLKPGRYQLRLAAHSTLSNKSGSVFADITVPDFALAPVSLSGIMIEQSPGVPSSPRETFQSLLPIVPTSERLFAAGDSVKAFVRVYQGGITPTVAVPVTIHILDSHGTSVFDKQDSLAAASFTNGRGADEFLLLPLSNLPPGPYLLEISAQLGSTTAKGDLRFAIKNDR